MRSQSTCCVWPLLRTETPSQETPAETSTSGPKVKTKPDKSFHYLKKITFWWRQPLAVRWFSVSSELQVETALASRCRGPMRVEFSPSVSWRTAPWCPEEGRTARWCCGATTTGNNQRWRWWPVCIEGIILRDLICAPWGSPGEAYERKTTKKNVN